MADALIQPAAPQLLADVLARDHRWTDQQRLLVVRQLAVQVSALHAAGRIHRDIRAETIELDDRRQPRLRPPSGPQWFGGEQSDPEFCPPELAGAEPVRLPAEIEAALAVLRQHHHTIAPRRIDVYQLGVLLCRLLTGEPVMTYIYSPTAKAKVPVVARAALSRALGFDDANPFADCAELLPVLDEAIRQAAESQTPDAMHETPPRGSILWTPGDTPPDGNRSAADAAAGAAKPGQLPFERLGHYRVVERIGAGGMGDVYRGYDESLDRYVALKVLPPELARDASFVQRFHAEATAAAKVAHPNIVPVYFIGEDGGRHFFAMQYIEGESLAARLERKKRLGLDEALTVVDQCLAGLGAAHARGLIHRDVKPANVLLDRQADRAVLVDFGLVRTMDSSVQMTATGVVMGTCDYIAPEQARGQKTDGRADIYSLGVLLYQLLAGRLPYHAETPTAMIFQHAYEEPQPLAEVAPNVPVPVVAIIARMMAKDPAARYADCGEVLADIRAFREGRPLASAEPVGQAPPCLTSAGDNVSSLLDRQARGCMTYEDEAPVNDVALPEFSLPFDNPVQRARDWAATMFRRHAPEALKQLQSTTQQVDGAVAEYQRRRDRVARLMAEGRAVLTDLTQQIEANVQASAAAEAQAASATDQQQRHDALAKKQQCDEDIAALRRQHDQQQHEIEDFQQQLGKAETTLAQLRSQRDVLMARLKAAEVQQTPGTQRGSATRFASVLLQVWKETLANPRKHKRTIVATLASGVLLAFLLLSMGRLLLPEAQPMPLRAPLRPMPVTPSELPSVVATVPGNNEMDVDPSLTEIRLTFSREMRNDCCSFVGVSPYAFPVWKSDGPKWGSAFYYLADGKTWVWRVKLAAGQDYAISFNTGRFEPFQDLEGRSAVPFILRFRTRSQAGSLPVAKGDRPIVVATVPHNNEMDVDPSLAEIRVTFSEAIGSCNFTPLPGHSYPRMAGKADFLRDIKTLVVPVELKPNTNYGISFDEEGAKRPPNSHGPIAAPYELTFRTASQPGATGAKSRTGTAKRPAIVRTEPTQGATVDPSLAEIRVVFDTQMSVSKITVTNVEGYAFPSKHGDSHFLEDRKTYVWPMRLKPDTEYAVSFPENYRATKADSAMPGAYVLKFRTHSQHAGAGMPLVVLPTGGPPADEQVIEGVGWGPIRLGATREELTKVYGPLEPTFGGPREGWAAQRHIDFWFDESGHAVEVRFRDGFNSALRSGIRIGSPEKDVLSAYGNPENVRYQSSMKMLDFNKHGVLLWVKDGKVVDFTVVKPSSTAAYSTVPPVVERPLGAAEAPQQVKWYCAGPGYKELQKVASSRGIWLKAVSHYAPHYEAILSDSPPGSIIVLLFALDAADKMKIVPAGYEDLLPMPWPQIEAALKKGETVEVQGKARERNIVLLAAPTEWQLGELIHKTKLLSQ